MKKFFLSTFLCLIMCVCCFGLMGCNGSNKTKDDIDSLFTSMKTETQTADFFDGNYLKITFDSTKLNLTSSDKSYIFPQVYSHYLTASSSLFCGVIDRVGTSIFKSFTQSQINSIYFRLNAVKNSLLELSQDKYVYELTNGSLHYKNVIASYNTLIQNLYELNDAFAEFYFVENLGYIDFSSSTLKDGNIKDMLRYQLLNVSKVSFNYELLNFMFDNPLGEINTWYNSTTTLKSFVELAKLTNDELGNRENLADHIGSNSQHVLRLFTNMQDQQDEYFQEYSNFIRSVSSFNVKSYFSAANKPAYIENSSYKQQSYFNLIQNFISGRYKAYTSGISSVLSYM